MINMQPGLFGLKYSNRDFAQKESWGKNCFNSSLPAAICAYLSSQSLDNVYIKLRSDLKIQHHSISTTDLYGLHPDSENLFYAFETQFTPYQKYVIGTLPGVDLVTQSKIKGQCLQGIEIKLTALPDHTTCHLSENQYGCEIVVRPQTIAYLACSIIDSYSEEKPLFEHCINNANIKILNWTEQDLVIPNIPRIIETIDSVALLGLGRQRPLLMQPIWKTEGKSPRLAENCLDVFVWSDLAFTRLFIDLSKQEIEKFNRIKSISRHTRTIIWLFKMLQSFCDHGSFNYKKIIDSLSYNTGNDKAFAISGRGTHPYMESEVLRKPRIHRDEIKDIILGGGQNLLSPERRLDAIIYNSPDLFSN
ncbi:HindVP family restriction endonuclease [Limnothrix redekei]